jgi:hypothetical protein
MSCRQTCRAGALPGVVAAQCSVLVNPARRRTDDRDELARLLTYLLSCPARCRRCRAGGSGLPVPFPLLVRFSIGRLTLGPRLRLLCPCLLTPYLVARRGMLVLGCERLGDALRIPFVGVGPVGHPGPLCQGLRVGYVMPVWCLLRSRVVLGGSRGGGGGAMIWQGPAAGSAVGLGLSMGSLSWVLALSWGLGLLGCRGAGSSAWLGALV